MRKILWVMAAVLALLLVPLAAPSVFADSGSSAAATVVSSGGWASVKDINKNPSKYPAGVQKMAAVASGGPTTMSASGCNLDVCIDVVGRSTSVSAWRSQAFGNQGCIVGHFDSNRGTYNTPQICPYSLDDGVYFWNAGPTGYFSPNQQLCSRWDRIVGHPCIRIIR